MSESKHTGKPWYKGRDLGGHYCGEIWGPEGSDEIVTVADWVAEKDADLISAAPELLEALQEIDRWSRRQNIALPSDAIYRAIAKATGQ